MDYYVKDKFEALIEIQKQEIKDRILNSYIEMRKKNGITQQQIAEYTGMQRTNIVRIESGKYMPTLEVLIKLAAAVGMDLEVRLVERKTEHE